MKLYHGTNMEFDRPDESKPNKDFGRGFYLSDNYEQAMAMAKTKVEQLETGIPIVLTYEIPEEVFRALKVLRYEEYSEEWAKFIMLNRNNSGFQQAHDYDLVIGPIANDKVGLQLWRYENHAIDLPTLVRNLHYMKGVTIQYFFGTERALQQLKRL